MSCLIKAAAFTTVPSFGSFRWNLLRFRVDYFYRRRSRNYREDFGYIIFIEIDGRDGEGGNGGTERPQRGVARRGVGCASLGACRLFVVDFAPCRRASSKIQRRAAASSRQVSSDIVTIDIAGCRVALQDGGTTSGTRIDPDCRTVVVDSIVGQKELQKFYTFRVVTTRDRWEAAGSASRRSLLPSRGGFAREIRVA